jgi:hypothetical protein
MPAVAVLYTSKPVAGEGIGPTALLAVKATRGGRNPLSVAVTSSLADAFGVFVPMPVWAFTPITIKTPKNKKILFITIIFYRTQYQIIPG